MQFVGCLSHITMDLTSISENKKKDHITYHCRTNSCDMSLSGSPKTSCSALVLKYRHISNVFYCTIIKFRTNQLAMEEGRG